MRAPRVLSDAFIPELPNHYKGKVRENYDLSDGRRIIIATDRLSAFDVILTAIPLISDDGLRGWPGTTHSDRYACGRAANLTRLTEQPKVS